MTSQDPLLRIRQAYLESLSNAAKILLEDLQIIQEFGECSDFHVNSLRLFLEIVGECNLLAKISDHKIPDKLLDFAWTFISFYRSEWGKGSPGLVKLEEYLTILQQNQQGLDENELLDLLNFLDSLSDWCRSKSNI